MGRFIETLKVFCIGFCMGIADLIPGVSGGTIAFITGIYDRLIDGIKSLDLEILRCFLKGRFKHGFKRIPFLFFLPLGLGLLSAIFSLSRILATLFETHPVHLWSFFFGLIVGSIVLLFLETRPWRPRDGLAFALAGIITFFIVGLDALHTPSSPIYLFLAGCIAISAMILPGISGSYILVILGKYQQVLAAVNERDFFSLASFLVGMVVGILSFVRVVSWLLSHFRQATMVALTGIMAGALRAVWPWKETVETRVDSSGAIVPTVQRNVPPQDVDLFLPAVALALLGALVVLALNQLSPGRSEKQAGG